MTAIAACAWRGKCYLAGDSAVTVGDVVVTQAPPKVWHQGAFGIGAAGDGVFDSILAGLRWSGREWLLSEALGDLRQALQDAGSPEGEAIIAHAGQLYYLGDSLFPLRRKYGAVGTGAGVCLGYLAGSVETPQQRVKGAVQAACEHAAGCRTPVHVITV